MLPRLLTAEAVAEILGISRAQAYLLKDSIGYVIVGARTIRFEPDAVAAYVANRRRCHDTAPASTATRKALSGTPSGPIIRVGSTVNPRVAETMARQRRGLHRAN